MLVRTQEDSGDGEILDLRWMDLVMYLKKLSLEVRFEHNISGAS